MRDRQVWRLPSDAANGAYRLVLRLLAGDETSPAIELGQTEIAGRAHSFEPPVTMERTSGATFGALGRLLGYDGPVITGETLALTLYWQALGRSASPHNVSVQLLDASGVLAAQRGFEILLATALIFPLEQRKVALRDTSFRYWGWGRCWRSGFGRGG